MHRFEAYGDLKEVKNADVFSVSSIEDCRSQLKQLYRTNSLVHKSLRENALFASSMSSLDYMKQP